MNISICIPTYKRPVRVLEALKSCLDQSTPPYEILIGDDSPDDLTKTVIEKFQNDSAVSIRYFKNNPNLGQVDNVNSLFEKAKGDKIMLLHDDDQLVPNTIQTLIKCFEDNPGISAAYGKQYIMWDNGKIDIEYSEHHNEVFYRTELYEKQPLTSLESGIVQQFPNNGYLIEASLAKDLKYAQIGDACDFDFGLRLGKTGKKLCFVNEYVSKYRISTESITNSENNDAGLTSYLLAKNTKVPKESLALKKRYLRRNSKVALGQALDRGKIKLALDIYISSYPKKMVKPKEFKKLLKRIKRLF